MAAPTRDEIKTQLLRHAPHWFKEPDEVADAMLEMAAAIFERFHGALQTLFDRTLVGLADGSWLDEHGEERVKPRFADELDADYRPRILGIDDRATKNAILAAIDALLEIGTATMDEDTGEPDYVPPAGTLLRDIGHIGVGNAFESDREFTLTIADQNPQRQDTSWALPTGSDLPTSPSRSFSWENAVSGSYPQPGSYPAGTTLAPAPALYSAIVETLDQMRAAGVSFRVKVG